MAKVKYKVRITNLMDDSLNKDMVLFKFIKSNNSLNKNNFYNELISNMYIYYKDRRKYLNNYLINNLNKYINDDNIIYNLSIDLNNLALSLDVNDTDYVPLQTEIYIYPTNDTSSMYSEIEVNELKNNTMSEFLRSLLSSYIKMPLYTRETIILRDYFNLLLDSIENDKIIYIETKDDEFYIEPYFLTIHEKTLHTYLIGYKINNEITEPFSIAVKDIYNAVQTNNKYIFNKTKLNELNSLTDDGPEYINEPIQEIIVAFTEKGAYKADSIGISHMNVIDIDQINRTVTFDCSIEHMYNFLLPFGKEATVIKPIELKNKLKEFYKEASI